MVNGHDNGLEAKRLVLNLMAVFLDHLGVLVGTKHPLCRYRIPNRPMALEMAEAEPR